MFTGIRQRSEVTDMGQRSQIGVRGRREELQVKDRVKTVVIVTQRGTIVGDQVEIKTSSHSK